MRTIVEFYDKDDLDNTLSLFVYAPERVIYIVPDGTDCAGMEQRYQSVLRRHDISVVMQFISVDLYSFSGIRRVLTGLIKGEGPFVFDMTGGNDISLAAMGAVSVEKQVPLLRFEPESKRPHWYLGKCPFERQFAPKLSCEDWFALYGAKFSPDNRAFEEWDINEELRRDAATLWTFCAQDIQAWNDDCGFPARLAYKSGNKDPLTVSLSADSFKKEMRRPKWDKEFLLYLHEHGLIRDLTVTDQRVAFTFKNEQILRILKKAGNLLELYTCSTALATGKYHDCRIGVFINWDGMDQKEKKSHLDTTNELDVFLIRDFSPMFISCKNGEVRNDALYELQSIAERFGGKHIRKALVSTYVNPSSASRQHILHRAQHMGIKLVGQVHQMSQDELRRVLFSEPGR